MESRSKTPSNQCYFTGNYCHKNSILFRSFYLEKIQEHKMAGNVTNLIISRQIKSTIATYILSKHMSLIQASNTDSNFPT